MSVEQPAVTLEYSGYRIVERLLSKDQIAEINQRLAGQINRDYEGKDPLFVIVLNGALVFGRDLTSMVDVGHCGYDTISISSYEGGETSSGEPVVTKDLKTDIKGRHVLIIEDIVDTGRSIKTLRGLLSEREPASLAVCTLLDKSSRREVEVPLEYIGIEIPDKFVVGYGLDVDELFRLLNGVYVAERIPSTT